ncbi:MAG TPA: cysteine desulfurase NifS [Firmicutes bacterium]|nr:cysteine desulfurase NifS [Bacillota bacterium]
MRRVYLDHAATTPVRPEVLDAMVPFFTEKFGNASSIHSFGREARTAVDESRDVVARALGADPAEIIFTSGGTESDNTAIKGVALANRKKGNHIITSAVEHHAVMDSCKSLEQLGFEITFVPVDGTGMVSPDDVRSAMRPDTILISIMHANNEVGTIQPIEEIAKVAREAGVYFHTDAVQSVGNLPVNVEQLGVDLLSLSGHKLYGPKGIGMLYVRKGVKISPYMHGGGQERGRRAGTENVAGIVGLAKAIELAVEEQGEYARRLARLRDMLIRGVMDRIPDVVLTGHPERRLPGNASFCFKFVEGESILLNLDLQGIAGSSGSACTSGSLEPSHVLLAMGLPHEVAHGSLRLTLGRDNTEEDVQYVLDTLPGIIERLRAMSPFGR